MKTTLGNITVVLWHKNTTILIKDYHRNRKIVTQLLLKNDIFWDVTLCGSCKTRHLRNLAPPSSG
jgi:hypothetical protein